MSAHRKDLGARLLGQAGFKPQTAADDTLISGHIVDRHDIGLPLSMTAAVGHVFTAASTSGSPTNTLTVVIQHGDNSALSDAATLKSYTLAITCGDDTYDGWSFLAADLSAAKRYVRVQAKLTEAGTITVSAQQLTACAVFGGADIEPDPAYVSTGYSDQINV